MAVRTFTAILHREGDLYVAECPEVGTVSQGYTVEEALDNLKEATGLYLEEFPFIRSLLSAHCVTFSDKQEFHLRSS